MRDDLSRVYITGASGSGVTTLGAALAARIGAAHIDTDDHYWAPTDLPFQVKREVPERIALISAAQGKTGRWVVSGALESWGESVLAEVQLIIFLEAPTELRLERLRRREAAHFGDAILPGGPLHEIHQAFLDWTAEYDSGSLSGRSRPRHEKWLAAVAGPVLRLDGTRPVHELVAQALTRKS